MYLYNVHSTHTPPVPERTPTRGFVMPAYIRTANSEMKHQPKEVRKPRNKYNYSITTILLMIMPHAQMLHTVNIKTNTMIYNTHSYLLRYVNAAIGNINTQCSHNILYNLTCRYILECNTLSAYMVSFS